MSDNQTAAVPMTPDFYHYNAAPIRRIEQEAEGLWVIWPDGHRLRCHRFWLRENAMGYGGIDLATREGVMDPAALSDAMQIRSCEVTESGDLRIIWAPDGARCVYHSGWLRHIADGQHRPHSWVPEPALWTAASLPKPPRRNAIDILSDDSALSEMLNDLLRLGVCVVEQAPCTPGFLNQLAARIGPVRDSNFGMLWDVKADVNLAGDAKTNTTANTGFRLGPHTDLPTREIPPGFQFLHCLINEADGGESTLTDGGAVVSELKTECPDDYALLSTRRWIFFNRGPGIDHRFSAPIVDYLDSEALPTIRAFYPVRAFPDMPHEDVGPAYAALRRFYELADNPRFELTFRLRPGDIMCFDNRRILHGRKAFSGSGQRHLQGIYIDRDEVLSTARAVNRACARD
ncbi:MAG: gamma-butyrobetaine,2-oxoglutarate dioxygenase [Halieaceae bacterium]|nr:gamma-butyrobetaine,2-oxoglutarate dioxygenase [Halieaceae bacterium]|tara:strand:+ start:12581 stop:13786 length:1206 start_codon:yes stop_codon:yes gene_type:complete